MNIFLFLKENKNYILFDFILLCYLYNKYDYFELYASQLITTLTDIQLL